MIKLPNLRDPAERRRIFRYLVGGNVEFFIGYSIFAIFYGGLHFNWLPAKILADTIGWSASYLIYRFWAFSDRIHLSEIEHAGRYITIESIGFVMDYGIIGGLKAIGITPYIGMFLSAWFFSVWSYLWYKYWVFPEKKKQPKNSLKLPKELN